MKKLLANFTLWLFGWKSETKDIEHIKKSVMIAAPHTSNWDLIFMVAIFWKHDINVKFLIKNMYTKGIHGGFFRWLGAIGIDRKKSNNTVDFASSLFAQHEELILIIPPEGTRKRVDKWRKGFYHIAKNSAVPISFGYLDYKEKIGGSAGFINLTDSMEDDFTKIQAFYKTKAGKFPDEYNPKIY